MTRINLVPPKDLIREHLIAEYKELPRVFGLVHKRVIKGDTPAMIKIPQSYILGPGHVTFFYDKLEFLKNRFALIVEEMKQRGYTVNFENIPEFTKSIPPEWWNDYKPTKDEEEISWTRIRTRTIEIVTQQAIKFSESITNGHENIHRPNST